MNWEYTQLSVTTGQTDELVSMLDALGSVSWEAVGVTMVDKTIGINSVMVLLKREAPAFPEPPDLASGWKTDPAGRFAQRRWDGLRWERHVSNDNGRTQEFDLPTVLG